MKLMHLADLHIGKRVNGYQMLEDQRYVLQQIVQIAQDQRVDGVLIAGDFYDRPLPPESAVELADEFLVQLNQIDVPVFLIGGNHDSTERLSFLSGISRRQHIYISHPYDGLPQKFELEDEYGLVNIYLLPFVTPSEVRHCHKSSEVSTYDEAVRLAVESMEIDSAQRNILVAHQLVLGSTSPIRSDSEQLSIGGTEEVSASAFEDFDYVALGHLHASQCAGSDKVQYAGSPLKYSFSEINQNKSATIIELGAKGQLEISKCSLTPLHDMAQVRGTLPEIREQAQANPQLAECYMRAILTEPVAEAKSKLTDLFPLLMKVEFDYAHTGQLAPLSNVKLETLNPMDVFEQLFNSVHGRQLNENEANVMSQVLQEIAESSKGGDAL